MQKNIKNKMIEKSENIRDFFSPMDLRYHREEKGDPLEG